MTRPKWAAPLRHRPCRHRQKGRRHGRAPAQAAVESTAWKNGAPGRCGPRSRGVARVGGGMVCGMLELSLLADAEK